ncbi:hypothetical protein DXG01_012703 [Tephrocybe rancida]|nr:hypothetical protein DXG01_012703 [Tephrocybe rancida]
MDWLLSIFHSLFLPFQSTSLPDKKRGDPFMDDPKETDVVISLLQKHPRHNRSRQKQSYKLPPDPRLPGRRLILLDTPGFDNTDEAVDDKEVLRRIAVWLARSYSAHMQFAGIIYLHNISQPPKSVPRVHMDLEMLSKLSGTTAARNVVLATTKWRNAENHGEGRENMLRERHWRAMLESGSVLLRYDEKQESAQKILDHILKQEPLTAAQIQEEMIDGKKAIAKTEAGQSLIKTS